MKNATLLILIITMITSFSIKAQVSINTDGTEPDATAILDVKSTSKGMLVPRMSLAEIELITSPANGLIVFNNTDNKFYAFVSTDNEWKEILYGPGTITPPWPCGASFVDARDSQSYNTVQIGTQCWMAENLNIGTRIDGSNNQIDNGTIEKYCYDDDPANCNIYGGLYQWDEMMQYVTTEGIQGICPSGWHLPTDAEWKTMEMYLGMTQAQADTTGYRGTDEGDKLKSTSGWLSNGNGTNTSGFTALAGGYRSTNGGFNVKTLLGYWWSSTEYDSSYSWGRVLSWMYSKVLRSKTKDKRDGFSVRCLKN